jgi:hypothetical protein
VTTAAETRIFLNIRIIPHRENYADNADDKQDRDKDCLVPGGQTAIKLFKKVFEKFDHTGIIISNKIAGIEP